MSEQDTKTHPYAYNLRAAAKVFQSYEQIPYTAADALVHANEFDAMHTRIAELEERIAELEARNAELKVTALKTADGVLLTDDMEVWIPNANGVLGGPIEKRVLTTERLLYKERDAYGRVGARLRCCYSTRQAAEATRGKGVG